MSESDRDEQDTELIKAVRNGDLTAYSILYERHVAAAYNLARQLARSQADRDDLVAGAFEKVLDQLHAGNGPDRAFRPYLLTAQRHTAYDKTRRDRKLELADDLLTVGARPDALSEAFTDTVLIAYERKLAARAFSRLPKLWQEALTYTVIEGLSPEQAAPRLGTTPNGMSALAYRARAALRAAYLQVHLTDRGVAASCRPTVDQLGAWVQETTSGSSVGLSKRTKKRVGTHLTQCSQCRERVRELAFFSPRNRRDVSRRAARQRKAS